MSHLCAQLCDFTALQIDHNVSFSNIIYPIDLKLEILSHFEEEKNQPHKEKNKHDGPLKAKDQPCTQNLCQAYIKAIFLY